MRSWPDQLRALHPLPRGRHPQRPWWRYVQPEHVWRRSDGKTVRAGDTGAFRDKRELLDLISEIDIDLPLPFPGRRAGQLWAALEGETVRRVIFLQSYDPGPAHPGLWRPWVIDGRAAEEIKVERMLTEAVLVADISCPWCAPWAPKES